MLVIINCRFDMDFMYSSECQNSQNNTVCFTRPPLTYEVQIRYTTLVSHVGIDPSYLRPYMAYYVILVSTITK